MANHPHSPAYQLVAQPLMNSEADGPYYRRPSFGPGSPPFSPVTRKPVPSASIQQQQHPLVPGGPGAVDGDSSGSGAAMRSKAGISWSLPLVTIFLFQLGFAAALGHHFYLRSLHNQVIEDQVWTGRFSLALAFITKSALSAAFVGAYFQSVWRSMSASNRGISVRGVDALFTVLTTPSRFFEVHLWRFAPLAALMGLSIWLLPLAAVVSPTALTVGILVQNSTIPNCMVPALDLGRTPSSDEATTSLSLTTTNYEELNFNPSMACQRLVGLAARNGRQVDWPSPCGDNCTYSSEFVAPAWECTQTQNMDDPTAVWRLPGYWLNGEQASDLGNESYWLGDYGNGNNITVNDEDETGIEYGPVYAGGVNANTTQFWFGVVNPGMPVNGSQTMTMRQFLDPHIYSCNLYLSHYSIRVSYTSGVQNNEILNVTHLDRVLGNQYAWQSSWSACMDEGDPNGPILCQNSSQLDAVSLSQVILATVQGTIMRDPREILSSNTSIALVPPLVEAYTGEDQYGEMEPMVPRLALGPLLEDLSHNASLSLLSEPNLGVIYQASTTCSTSHTLTVWKYNYVPLAIAYSLAIAATLLGLAAGAHALLTSRATRDMSFSSVIRTTRNAQLDILRSERAGLPLDSAPRDIRVKLDWGARSTGTDQFNIVAVRKPPTSSEKQGRWYARRNTEYPRSELGTSI